jgi:flagellar transcriptional activator FlhD
MMVQLTPGQVLKIAGSNMLMCRFRFDDDVVWNLLTSHSKSNVLNDTPNVSGIHAGILMAGKLAESHRMTA